MTKTGKPGPLYRIGLSAGTQRIASLLEDTSEARVKRGEMDSGQRAGIPSDTAAKKALGRENRALRPREEGLGDVRPRSL